MNCGFNYGGGCGCNSCMPTTFLTTPYGFGGCQNFGGCNYGLGGGTSWFAIVLVIFLLLIICGCSKIC